MNNKINEVTCADWVEFANWLSKIRQDHSEHAYTMLFRGHSEYAWKMRTTLERVGKYEMQIQEYYELIRRIKSPLESLSGKDFNLDSPHDTIEKFFKDLEAYDATSLRLSFGKLPWLEFMVYLRHHGFPSPLLDWSRSPYVAAFFAFQGRAEESEAAGRCAIYALLPETGCGRVSSSRDPSIRYIGPNIKTHRRHYLQQSEYTVSVGYHQDVWKFVPHESAFAVTQGTQDLLWKVSIPHSERVNALKYLDEHNINSYSLFDSEESLLSTLSMRQFLFQ